MDLLANNGFYEMTLEELGGIDGGKAWYTWLGDIGTAVGAVASLVPGVGVGYIATYAGVAYIYSMNR